MPVLAPLVVAFLTIGVFLLVAEFLGFFNRRSTTPEVTDSPGLFGGYFESLRADMVDAGIETMSPERFTLISAAVGIAVGFAVIALLNLVLLGILVGFFVGTVWLRKFYIGRTALRRRIATVRHVADACREIADALDDGTSPTDALDAYASRAKPGSASERLTGGDNAVARALRESMYLRDAKGAKPRVALRTVAEKLANRYFTAMVEVFISNVDASNAQLSAGLRRVAVVVDYALRLRQERLNMLRTPIGSYQMVGGTIAALVLLSQFISPQIGAFYAGLFGQILIIFMIGWWYIGFTIVRRHLNDKI